MPSTDKEGSVLFNDAVNHKVIQRGWDRIIRVRSESWRNDAVGKSTVQGMRKT
jgi:hypothetical protein